VFSFSGFLRLLTHLNVAAVIALLAWFAANGPLPTPGFDRAAAAAPAGARP
jgi:hypothetical protein